MSDLISSWQNYKNLKENYSKGKNKGGLGEAIETLLFGLKRNTSPKPDFEAAHVELKVTGLQKIKGTTSRGKKGELMAKERLILGMINYHKFVNETWKKMPSC